MHLYSQKIQSELHGAKGETCLVATKLLFVVADKVDCQNVATTVLVFCGAGPGPGAILTPGRRAKPRLHGAAAATALGGHAVAAGQILHEMQDVQTTHYKY